MKKIFLISLLIVFGTLLSFGQEPSLFVSQGNHYKVYSEVSAVHAEETAKKMDAFFELFNGYFRYPADQLDTKLKVRVFSSKERFDNYLEKIIDRTTNSFVYLQYSELAKSELIGFKQPAEEYKRSLLRHGSIQFFKSFIKNPPEWLLKGVAIFFEKSSYDEEHQLAVFEENLGWLNTLKANIRDENGKGLIPLQTFFNPSEAVLEERGEAFHAQAWGVVSFLRNSDNKNYNRILWDSLSVLEPEASEKENISAIKQKSFKWVNTFLLINDFKNYIFSKKTFPELVEEGVELYSVGNYERAEEVLLKAILLDGSHYLPYYYLGLINYAKKDYSLAEYYYQSALMLGADTALIHYALGVAAFSNGRLEDARNYLEEAIKLDEEKYEEKAERLLDRIEEMQYKEAGYGM